MNYSRMTSRINRFFLQNTNLHVPLLIVRKFEDEQIV